MAIALRASSSSASTTINKPSGTIDGDLMVMWIVANSSQTSPPTMTGWTRVGTGTARGWMFYRFASSEPSSYTITATSSAVAILSSWSGVNSVGAGYFTQASGTYYGPTDNYRTSIGNLGEIPSGAVTLSGIAYAYASTSYFTYPLSDEWGPEWDLLDYGFTGYEEDSWVSSVAKTSLTGTAGNVFSESEYGQDNPVAVLVLTETAPVDVSNGLVVGLSATSGSNSKTGSVGGLTGIEAAEFSGEAKAGTVGIAFGLGHTIDVVSGTFVSAGMLVGSTASSSTGHTRTVSIGAAIGISANAVEPESKLGTTGLAVGASATADTAFVTEYAIGFVASASGSALTSSGGAVSAGVSVGVTAEVSFAQQKAGTVGVLIGNSHLLGHFETGSISLLVGVNSGESGGSSSASFRTLVAMFGGRVSGDITGTIQQQAIASTKRIL